MPINRTHKLQENYIRELFSSETSLHRDILQALREDGKEGINVSSSEGQMLAFFVKAFKAQKVLEIGTLYGYSSLWIAEALGEKGNLISLEKDPVCARKSKEFLSSYKNVEIIEGEALETLKTLDSQFDLVFIDANKSAYKDYLDWAEEHTHSGSLIVGDNTFLFGHVYEDPEAQKKLDQKTIQAMKAFNKRLADPEIYETMLVPTNQGMTVAYKK